MSQHIIVSLSLSVIRETHTRPVGVADSVCVCARAAYRPMLCTQKCGGQRTPSGVVSLMPLL